MSTPFDTQDYGLQIVPSWYRKNPRPTITCTKCMGDGKIGGGIFSLDDAEDCSWCNGNGKLTVYDDNPPEFPEGMTEFMRKAFQDYCKMKANEVENCKGFGI